MNDDLLNQPSSKGANPNQEKWVSKKEIQKRFKVSDRNLTYWRGLGKISYKKIRNRTYYIASEIQAMVKKQSRPKKFVGIRKVYIKRKLDSMDAVLGVAIIALVYLWIHGVDFSVRPWWVIILDNGEVAIVLSVCLVYGLVRLIIYLWRRHFRKND